MLKKIRVYVSIFLVTILLIAPLIFSDLFSVKACPIESPPETLVSLFLRSDLIVVADFTSQKDGEITTDEETYQEVNVTNNLKVSKVLKGKIGKHFSFTSSEYRDKTPPEETVEDEEYESYGVSSFGYPHYSELTVGNRYLFFFNQDKSSGNYVIADDISGYKLLNDRDLEIYEKRIAELKKIVETKKNQLQALTDWYIKCIEEPATRWDGVRGLRTSLAALEYEDEDEKAEREKFVIDENFREYAPQIAEKLTDSQKNFLSGIVFSTLPQNLFTNEGNNLYYNLDGLVVKWDKQRLAMFAFNLFQTADKSDIEKTKSAMKYIYLVTEDNKLWDHISEYESAEESAESEENVTALQTDSETLEVVEIASTEKVEKLSPAEIREKALQDFTNRYYQLLSRNFVEEEVEEIAQN